MISDKELLFVSSLRKSARKTLTKISKELNIPVSTLFEKLKKLEKALIVKHTAILDFNKLGYTTRAKILLKVSKKDREKLREMLSKSEYVNSLYKITNGFDFLVEGIFKSLQQMENFIEELEDRFQITKKNVYFVIDDVKREKFLSDVELTKMMQK
ncbi:MAG: Lrp/AsnC ligand binding domain-containing protein [Candidatus Nanoarchaeia archaeon]